MSVPTVVTLLGRGVTLSTSGTGSSINLGSPTAITCNDGIAICDVTAVGNAGGETVTRREGPGHRAPGPSVCSEAGVGL